MPRVWVDAKALEKNREHRRDRPAILVEAKPGAELERFHRVCLYGQASVEQARDPHATPQVWASAQRVEGSRR